MRSVLEFAVRASRECRRRHRALTPGEHEVLRWVKAGKSNGDIAGLTGLSISTVGKHLERIYTKLGVENRTAAASFYREEG